MQISTREDAWAVRLLNTLRGLHQLLETGLARELYVFGRIQVRAVKQPSSTASQAETKERLEMHGQIYACKLISPSSTEMLLTVAATGTPAAPNRYRIATEVQHAVSCHRHLNA